MPDIAAIEPTALKARLDRGDPIFILDVREPYEIFVAPFPGALTPVVSIARNHGECPEFVNATLEDGPNEFLDSIGVELGKAARRVANGTAH